MNRMMLIDSDIALDEVLARADNAAMDGDTALARYRLHFLLPREGLEEDAMPRFAVVTLEVEPSECGAAMPSAEGGPMLGQAAEPLRAWLALRVKTGITGGFSRNALDDVPSTA